MSETVEVDGIVEAETEKAVLLRVEDAPGAGLLGTKVWLPLSAVALVRSYFDGVKTRAVYAVPERLARDKGLV